MIRCIPLINKHCSRPNTELGQRVPELFPSRHSDEEGRVCLTQIFRKKGQQFNQALRNSFLRRFSLWYSLGLFSWFQMQKPKNSTQTESGEWSAQKQDEFEWLLQSCSSISLWFSQLCPPPWVGFTFRLISSWITYLPHAGVGGGGCCFYSHWWEILKLVPIEPGQLCRWCARVQLYQLLKEWNTSMCWGRKISLYPSRVF